MYSHIVRWCVGLLVVATVVAIGVRLLAPQPVTEPFTTCTNKSTTLTHETAVAFQNAINDLITAMDKRTKPFKPLTAAQKEEQKKKFQQQSKRIQNKHKLNAIQSQSKHVKASSLESFATSSTPQSIYIDACNSWYQKYNNSYAKDINGALKARNEQLTQKIKMHKEKAHAKKKMNTQTDKIHKEHCKMLAHYSGNKNHADPSSCPIKKVSVHGGEQDSKKDFQQASSKEQLKH